MLTDDLDAEHGLVMRVTYEAAWYSEMIEVAWQDLERALEMRRRPACVTPGCAEPARAVRQFRVAQGPLSFCGRTWQAGQLIDLCPRCSWALMRGEDPARPGVVDRDLMDAWVYPAFTR
jgi:hypothetical protein